MFRFLIGIFVLASLAQAFPYPNPEAVKGSIEALAKKLDDHFNGESIDDTVTIEDCMSSYAEYSAWSQEEYENIVKKSPLQRTIQFLDDFLIDHLNLYREKAQRLSTNDEEAKQYIEDLENAYARMRDTYSLDKSVRDSKVPHLKVITLFDSLMGKGKPISHEILTEGWEELESIMERWTEIQKSKNIFEHIDEYEKLNSFMFTPEVQVLDEVIMKHTDHLKTKKGHEKSEENFFKELSDSARDAMTCKFSKMTVNNE